MNSATLAVLLLLLAFFTNWFISRCLFKKDGDVDDQFMRASTAPISTSIQPVIRSYTNTRSNSNFDYQEYSDVYQDQVNENKFTIKHRTDTRFDIHVDMKIYEEE